MNRRQLLSLGAGALLAPSLLNLAACGQRQSNGLVRIAANVPTSGDLGVYGTSIRTGAELALARAGNAANLVSFDWQDNAGDAQRAVTIARSQVAQHPDIYISGLKPQTVAATPFVEQDGAVHFPWVLDVTINKSQPARNFRVWVSFALELQVFRSIFDARRPRRVAIWYFNTEAAVEQYTRILAPYCRDGGAEVMEEVIQSDSVDYRAVATRIAAFRPDLVFLNGFIPHMLGQIRALHPLGLIRPDRTVGGLDLLDAAAELQPAQVEGIMVAAPNFLVDPSPAATTWKEQYQTRFNTAPTYHAAYAFDMTNTILAAAAQPLPTERAARLEELSSRLRATSLDGVTGPIRLDEDQSLATALRLSRFQNGVPQPYTLPT